MSRKGWGFKSPLAHQNMFEKLHSNDLTELKLEFGETAEISETADGLIVKCKLQEGNGLDRTRLEGGQEIEALIGEREPLPIDLKPHGLELSGMPVKELKINGKLIEGYAVFVCPRHQNGDTLIGANFADAESKCVVISSLRDSYSLMAFFHETGHVDKGHGLNNRTQMSIDLAEKVHNKYVDFSQGTVHTESLKQDELAMDALRAIYEQETDANTRAIENVRKHGDVFSSDAELEKATLFLKQEVDFQYLAIYGIDRI